MELPKLFRKSSKMFRSFLFSYSIFLVIILCIGLLSIWISSSVIEEQVGQIYTASLEQVRTVADGYVSYAAKTASELMYNNKVQALQMAGDCTRPQDVMALTYLQEDIRSAMLVNPAISRIAVYFPAGEYVLDNTACYRSEMLERWSSTYYYTSFSELGEYTLSDYTAGKIVMLANPDTDSADLIYVKTLGDYPASVRQPVLLITIKGSSLSAILREYERTIGASVFFVMADGTVTDSSFRLAGSGDSSSLSGFTDAQDSAERSGGNYIKNLKSSVMDAKYIGVVPRSLYLDRVYHVINIILILLAGFIIIGIALAIYFSGRSSAPLEKMTRLLRSSGKALSDPESIYSYIEQTLSEIIDENKLLEKNLDEQKQEIRESFLVKLVRGNISHSSLQNMLEHYNIELEGDLVITTAYIVENAGPHFSDSWDESQNLINFSVRNTAEELTLNKYDCFICNIDNAILCVSSSGSPAAEFFRESAGIAATVVDFFDKKLSVKLTASVSRPYPGIASIPQAYHESLESLEYRAASGNTDHVCHSADREDSVDVFGYSINAERLFLNCIKGGDLRRAKEYLSDIVAQCRKIKSLPLMKVKIAGLAASVLSALIEYGNGSDAGFLTGLDPVRKLVDAKNIDVLELRIVGILDSVIAHSEEKAESTAHSSIEGIEEYLKTNFSDPLLNVTSLADKFGMNRSYLSQKFKALTGKSPIEYLNRLRIDRAKEMMEEGSFNLAEVAAACGYYDNHALNVVFKKYEGIPPSKYRALQGGAGKPKTIIKA